ncbi:TIGR03085 family metal-binding protein [Intrasporangium calvum]|uniref:TIGR03085 family metal-binding protein n=1 Tax=Intrasporangium calvum TaxID=53358 RepID=A0ABT5GDY7_9MICO|nr:TIGR03085 family metal-binding protein [Intrasporangium calvum]MDC5695896.1 TIGR03085 family metal-binding protein [Intrasporangium calvum]
MTRHAWSERQLLCDELERLGPDAPTLCEGWATRDLAAHLQIREARPDLGIGAYVPLFAKRLEREQRQLAETDYPALVDQVRAGAPAWNPLSRPVVDELANLVEYFVHHEDVRRAQPEWEPRDLPADVQAALWSALRRVGRLMFRRSPTGVVLVAPGVGRHCAKLPDEHGTVIVRGAPAELVLFAYGRADHADVQLEGRADDVLALKQARLGLG